MSELIALRTGDVRWQVDPGCRDQLFGPAGLRLPEWLAAGQAQVIKHGPHRTVYRVQLPGLQFYLKHCRLADVRAWLREWVRPAKAVAEGRRALSVAARRVPTVEPLALGQQWTRMGPGESFLITRSLESTEPLNRFIEITLAGFDSLRRTRVQQRLAVALGELIGRMHDAGIVHNDLHPGNLLVRLEKDDRPTLFLIDLHAVRLGRPLAWESSRANLILLNRWFVLRVSRADRLRFWRSYCRLRGYFDRNPAAPLEMGRDLEQRTWASNLAFWRSRDRRSLVTNRYYLRLHAPGVTGHAVQDLDANTLRTLLADPDAPFHSPSVRLLKNSRSSTVAEWDMPVAGGVRPVIYKRFRVTDRRDPWLALVRRTAALRSWVYGHGLRDRCLATPRPLLVLHRTSHGLKREGYLLMEKVSAAQELHGFVAGLADQEPAERTRLVQETIDQIARLVRRLHRCRISHRDLKASNILVTAESVWLIDLVGVVRHCHLGRPRRVQNLARLHASFVRNTLLTRTDKLRFLRIYLEWGLRGRGGWKRWWKQVEEATRHKVAKNARQGRPLC